MKNFIHFCMIPFTGLGLHGGYRGDSWFKYRIGLFKKYTLQSLLNQTNRNFITWIAVRPEERFNPICQEFHKFMMKLKDFPCVFTYGGIPIWDDKYKNDNLLERLEKTLPELKRFLKDEQWVYETCQPSDDVFHINEMKEIQEKEPKENRTLIHDKGYVFNEETQRLAEWNPLINPPFHTVMFPADVFFDPKKHFDYMKNSINHEDIIRKFDCVKLPDKRYCVVVHGKNISTNWWHPFRGKVFNWEEGKEILKDFGMCITPPTNLQGGFKECIIKIRYRIFKFLIFIRFYKVAKYVKNLIEFNILHKDR